MSLFFVPFIVSSSYIPFVIVGYLLILLLLRVYNDQLICYYSDQRDTSYGQKLTHQVTTDLESWTEQVDDVADTASYDARPGMPVGK